jgi:hypothetical protein
MGVPARNSLGAALAWSAPRNAARPSDTRITVLIGISRMPAISRYFISSTSHSRITSSSGGGSPSSSGFFQLPTVIGRVEISQ